MCGPHELKESDQTRVCKEIIWSDSWHEASPEVIWYHGNRDGTLRTFDPGKFLKDGAWPCYVQLASLWKFHVGCNWAHIAVRAPLGVKRGGSGPYPLIAAEILDRPRIHWSEYWTWTQYKLVPHCQWRWGPNYGVQIKPCSKRIAHTVGKHDFQYLLEYLTGKAKLQICTADIKYFDSRLWMHGRGSWYIKTRL